MAEFGIF